MDFGYNGWYAIKPNQTKSSLNNCEQTNDFKQMLNRIISVEEECLKLFNCVQKLNY